VTLSSSEDFDQKSIISALKEGINGLLQLTELETKDKFGVIGMRHLREYAQILAQILMSSL
jgi:hypothetical protein